ncbi:Glutamine-rich protein 2 [Orchesella cincta]|uniref:Glutamine-rich protein 2 n=1 Tax=Orchesella cincta TaxID=48709 RepID=A0A1D2MFC5_ORCCI|nr:Glutamine-rich protein 2 [Orchesella cincta]
MAAPTPPKPERKGAQTAAEVESNMPSFTVGDLVELALCSPEIGAVNFNILRLLLRDMIEKTGIDKERVKMNDLEAHQVENFKNFVQGAQVASPMPGVLKISPNGSPGPGMSYGTKATPEGGQKAVPQSNTKMTPRSPKGLPPTGDAGSGDLAEKVARLEKHLDALYQLPGNQELLNKTDGMSVNDMWQIIQLNNRIAAAEAAIQKMASLIEDLAKNMNRVKGDSKVLKKGADDLAATNSDLAIQNKDLADMQDRVRDAINNLKGDISDLKKGLKNDRDLLEKTLGVDLGRVPSFLKPKPEREPREYRDESPSQQFERGTQTFVHLKDKEKDKDGKPSGSKPQPKEKDQETGPGSQKASRDPEKQVGIGPDGKPYKPVKGADGKVPPSEIAKMSPEEIAKTITPEEAGKMTPEIYKKMTPEQRQAVKDLRKALPRDKKRPDQEKEPMGVADMSPTEVANLDPADIAERMSYEEAANLPPEVLEKMDDEQKEAIQNVLKKGPTKVPSKHKKKKEAPKPMGIAAMPENRLADLKPSDIASKMPYEEAANLPPELLDRLTEDQKKAIRKIVEAGPPQQPPTFPEDDDDDDELDDPLDAYVSPKRGSLEPSEPKAKKEKKKKPPPKPLTNEQILDIAQIPPEELASHLTAEMAAAISPEQLAKQFTPEQAKEIERLKKQATLEGMSPQDLVNNLTDDQLQELTQEQLDKLSPDQKEAVVEAKRKSLEKEAEQEEEGEGEEYEGDESEAETQSGQPKKERQKPTPHRHRGKDKHHHSKHHHHHHPQEGPDGERPHHAHVDIVQGPIPTVGEPLPPMSLEKYLATLPPEEAANLAADAVQRELQKQYAHLQGMQRQLAQDIQEKMEYIYQKLLKEIAAQQLTTSPYMSVGQDICMGPGVCTGHGMPAGIAVCQFPEASKALQAAPGAIVPHGGVSGVPDGTVCPGPGVCPGSAVCPYCQGRGQVQGEGVADRPTYGTGLQALKAPERKPGEAVAPTSTAGAHVSELDEALLKEMKSLMLLDLEKIREDMRTKKFGAFDEQDIVERLGAVWEALKILKHNEEAIAVKIARQDAVMKKLPTKMIDKLNKIPEENLEAIASGQFQKPMYFPEGSATERHSPVKDEAMPKPALRGTLTPADKEDIQTLYNNLANVISECTELKDRIDQLADTARIMEAGMVTKQMLLDALSDKADKGLINTKVSYDEFGNTVDELHTQLHNLMVEGYQRNENWKKVTSELAEELAEKLDKVELAPIRAFFKSHLKALEDKVKNLSDLIDEPDPAGTRKRLLRDYNCISCDRMVNITGVTNGPTLPTVGPIKAGHPTASRRALDLHRMRMLKQLDPNLKAALERQAKKGQKIGKKPSNIADPAQLANDIDVMHVVNRYTGGSHTNISNADRIASQRRPSNGSNPQQQIVNTAVSRTGSTQNVAAPAAAATPSPKGSRAGSLRASLARGSGIGAEVGGEEEEVDIMNEVTGEGSSHEMYEEEDLEMERIPSVPMLDPVMSGGNLAMEYPMGIEE